MKQEKVPETEAESVSLPEIKISFVTNKNQERKLFVGEKPIFDDNQDKIRRLWRLGKGSLVL